MKQAVWALWGAFVLGCAGLVPEAEPINQGFLWQLPNGSLEAHITSKGIHSDPRVSSKSVVMMYIYKKGAEIFQPCDSKETPDHCLDSFAFSNEPGFFGYDPTYQNYSPLLMSDGTNPHPITYLNLNLNQHLMRAFAASGKEFASTYFYDYNDFQSLNHVVFDGDRFDVYFAIHFNAIKIADQEKDRFDASSNLWLRPIAPDLLSPKISIKIKLLAEGPQDAPGNYYEIPPYETWTSCAKESAASGEVVISEVFWDDSVADNGDSKTVGDEDEFVELANISGRDINIGYWKLIVDSQEFTLPPCVVLPRGGYLALVSHKKYAFSETGLFISGLDLAEGSPNNGNKLEIQDAFSNSIYTLDCSSNAWPGGGANQSMVQTNNPPQNVDCSSSSSNWGTNNTVGTKISSLYNDSTKATPGEHP